MSDKESGDSLEIEVKFLVTDLRDIRERLLGLGANLQKPRTYEMNLRFDNPKQGLKGQGKLLRLRQDTVARITFKGESHHQINSEARVREEIEITVDDFDKAAAILERVGFEKQQYYEKYRETFAFNGVEVVLDEMPFGDFVELEGSEQAIRSSARALEFDWDDRITDNYLELMSRLQSRYNLKFDDISFSNFSGIEFSIADVLDMDRG